MRGIAAATPNFYNRLHEFSLMPLVEAPRDMVSGWLRELYVSLSTVLWEDTNPTIHTQGVDVPMSATIFNEVLGLLNISNVGYMSKDWDIDMRWLRDMLVVKANKDKVYWSSTEEVRSTFFTIDAWKWLNLVNQRIRPSSNTFYVTYPQALVACTMHKIHLNIGAQIVSEWKEFYRGYKKSSCLPSLMSELCRRVGVPR